MNNKDSNQVNIPIFYNQYAKQYYWNKEKAVALSLSLNPIKKTPESFLGEYNDRMELLKEAMKYDHTLELDGSVGRAVYGSSEIIYPKITPLSFIRWCRSKHFSFPLELEKMVKAYSVPESVGLETKYQKLELENQELKTEKGKLLASIDALNKEYILLEKDKPNTKSFNNYKQLSMGLLAVHYGNEQVKIWKNWANDLNKSTSKQNDLLFSKIQDDLAALNAKGINIKRDAIGDKIKESIYLLNLK